MRNENLAKFPLALFLIVLGCSKSSDTPKPPAPVLNFTFSGNTNPAPALVTFINSSTNATSYSWNFGDGFSSTEANPTHVYKTGGTYTVQLDAFNTTSSGTSESLTSKTITVANANSKMNIATMQLVTLPTSTSFTGYFKITDATNTNLFTSANTTINPATFPYSWTLAVPFVCSDITKTYLIQIWKVGVLSDTQIGITGVTPNLYIDNTGVNSYPKTLSLPASNGTTMNLAVTWY